MWGVEVGCVWLEKKARIKQEGPLRKKEKGRPWGASGLLLLHKDKS